MALEDDGKVSRAKIDVRKKSYRANKGSLEQICPFAGPVPTSAGPTAYYSLRAQVYALRVILCMQVGTYKTRAAQKWSQK